MAVTRSAEDDRVTSRLDTAIWRLADALQAALRFIWADALGLALLSVRGRVPGVELARRQHGERAAVPNSA